MCHKQIIEYGFSKPIKLNVTEAKKKCFEKKKNVKNLEFYPEIKKGHICKASIWLKNTDIIGDFGEKSLYKVIRAKQ